MAGCYGRIFRGRLAMNICRKDTLFAKRIRWTLIQVVGPAMNVCLKARYRQANR
ncbi:MAG TPA: hypothetical protein VKL99_15565 [Candidatus Angelobacter sp.]|nr:hypothetical protein [Candidatus Angelobacter sp.]